MFCFALFSGQHRRKDKLPEFSGQVPQKDHSNLFTSGAWHFPRCFRQQQQQQQSQQFDPNNPEHEGKESYFNAARNVYYCKRAYICET